MANPKPPSIIIVGGGIDGLITALLLHAQDLKNIHIFEAAAATSPIEVGINILPHAALLLRNIGILPGLVPIGGIEIQELDYYDRLGNFIAKEQRGTGAGSKVPQIGIRWGDFHQILHQAVLERLGEKRLHLNHRLSDCEQDEGGLHVTAHFVSGVDNEKSAEISEMSANLLIAADGINSTVRKILYPNEGVPRFSGVMMYHGCAETQPYLQDGTMIYAGNETQSLFAFNTSSNRHRSSNPSMTWTLRLRVRDEDSVDTTPPTGCDWTLIEDKSKLSTAFDEWKSGTFDLPNLIRKSDSVYELSMCDRNPVDQWAFHRIVLLGDAAHPMYQTDSNVANQAILDGGALARHLTLYPGVKGVPGALKSWEAERLPVTAKKIQADRGELENLLLQKVYERAPNGFERIRDVLSKEELEDILKENTKLTDLDVKAVNKKAEDTEGWAEILGLKPPQMPQ